MQQLITKPNPGATINPLHPLARGLVARWLFNEKSGSRIQDISNKNNHGTLNDVTWNGNGALYARSASKIKVNNSASLKMVDAITISAHIVPTIGTTGWRTIAGKIEDFGATVRRDLYLVLVDSMLTIALAGPRDLNWYTSVQVPSGIKTHIIVVYDDPMILVYKNGVLEDSLVSAGGSLSLAISPDPLYIGYNDIWLDEKFEGIIESMMIYNRVLNSFDVGQLYNDIYCGILQPCWNYTKYVYSLFPLALGVYENNMYNCSLEEHGGYALSLSEA